MANERVLPGLPIKGFADYKSDQWHLWADENWRMLAMRSGRWAKSRTTTIPGTGADGDVYIVPSGAGSNPNKVAVWDGPVGSKAWVYYTPQEGWDFWIQDEDKVYNFNGTNWLEQTGVSTFADLTDTNFTSLADGQIAKYDAGTGKWINAAESGGGGGSTTGGVLTLNQLFITGEAQTGLATGSWVTLGLDAEQSNSIEGATVSLATEEFTLQAGVYDVDAVVSFWRSNTCQARLYNVTDAAEAIRGSAVFSDTAANEASADSHIKGRLVLAAAKTFRLEGWMTTLGEVGNGAPDTGANFAKVIRITQMDLSSGAGSDGAGALMFVRTIEGTAAAQIDIPLDKAGVTYEIEGWITFSNDAVDLEGQVTNDNFSTVVTTASYRDLDFRANTTAVANTGSESATSMTFATNIGNAVDEFLQGKIEISLPHEAAQRTFFRTHHGRHNNANLFTIGVGGNLYDVAEAINGLRLFPSAGTVTFKLWVWAKVTKSFGVNTQTGTSYNMANSDNGQVVQMNNAAANTFNIQTQAAAGYDANFITSITQKGAGATTIQAPVGVTLNGVDNGAATINGQYDGVSLYKDGDDAFILQGAHGGVA